MASPPSSGVSSRPATPSDHPTPEPSHATPRLTTNGNTNITRNGVAMDTDAIVTAIMNGHSTNGVSTSVDASKSALGLDRIELVRIIAQAIRNLGYSHSAAELERESGVEAMSSDMRRLRECVLSGLWDELEGILERVNVFKSESHARAARFVLYEQKFLELLEKGHTADALSCLRNQLTECSPTPKALHRLPMLHMCRTSEELRRRADWPGAGTESRTRVLERLRAYIPHAHLLQENRLETLLVQAIQMQKRISKFPYTKQARVCLLEDLEHMSQRLPRTALHKLIGHTDEVWYVQFSHSGELLASGSKDKSIIIWDCAQVYSGAIRASDAVRFRLKGHEKDVCYVAWSPDDTRLLSCGSDPSILLWDVSSGEQIRTFKKHTKQVMSCVWMPHGRTFFSGSSDKKIFEWDVLSGEVISSYPMFNQVMDLALSKDGKRLICCDADRKITVFDTDSQTKIRVMAEIMDITSCSLAHDGISLLVTITSRNTDHAKHAADSEIHVWNIVAGEVVKKFTGFKQCRYVIRGCFGGHEQMFILCGSEDKLVHIWDRESGDLILRLDGHSQIVNSVAWSPVDAQLFASGSDDGTVIMWGVDPALRGRQSTELFHSL